MISVLGSTCNIYLLIKFSSRKEKPNGFQKICLVKTIPNIIVCLSFVFWVIPTTVLRLTYDELPYRLNSLIGSMAGNWSYVLTPMMQVCMACNRFYVLYFPFGIKSVKSVHITEISVTISILYVTILSSLNIPEGCGYIYDPEYFQWRPEYQDCIFFGDIDMNSILTDVFIYSIVILAATSNSFNVATAVRLAIMKNQMVGVNKDEAKKRRRRWLKMFTQSVIQDCLHLFDILNTINFWKLSEEPWFQFLCLTLSFIVIYTLDGLVMLICNKDVHPVWFRKIMKNRTSTSTLGTCCNMYLFFKFISHKPNANGFQKICLVKTVTNTLICSSFLYWVLPLTLLGYSYSQVNYVVNRAVGVVAPTWAYVLNTNLQVCLSCNRFYALYFPFGVEVWKSVPITSISIAISIAITSIFTAATLPGTFTFLFKTKPCKSVGCGYMFDPSLFVWRGEYSDCSRNIGFLFPLIILVTTIATSLFNVATGVKLLITKISGLSEENAQRRRKRWMIMFTQSVLQDCLQLFDTINSYYIVQLSDAAWFQFLFVTLSLVAISTLDGLIMFICHSDFRPDWLTRKRAMSINPTTVTG